MFFLPIPYVEIFLQGPPAFFYTLQALCQAEVLNATLVKTDLKLIPVKMLMTRQDLLT
jgi:hypothetical protein